MLFRFFSTRPRPLPTRLTTRLKQAAWSPLTLPTDLVRGERLDAHTTLFASPYDMPQGVRAAVVEDRWVLAWRYLDEHEPLRAVALSLGAWGFEGKHSGRLYRVEGQGLADGSAANEAMCDWLVLAKLASSVHQRIMLRLRAHSGDVLEAAAGRGDDTLADAVSAA